ncbi:hypothetical protein F4810DRAFT_132076 [Camillea tinctor]|nr:hypothetical protein F4810DRAFT_132076 [Camillea tinctor]
MPKRKKHHTARAEQRAAAKAQASKTKPRDPKPSFSLPPGDTLSASALAAISSSPVPITSGSRIPGLTLGDRFRLLPSEVRAAVFSALLVRPVKWDTRHAPACPLLTAAHPFKDIHPTPTDPSTCAYAHVRRPPSAWRDVARRGEHAWVDPWRSAWAPPQRNPYVCTACYDTFLRPRPMPETYSLPCLCARRRELQVLLVCRAWYAEAGAVFYGGNTLAFADAMELVGFFAALAPRWKNRVSKVSLLSLPPYDVIPRTAREDVREIMVHGTALKMAWDVLAQLPALSELELDAIYLTREEGVSALRGPALENLRRVTFVQGVPFAPMRAPKEFVWPRHGCRITVEDSEFVTQVARDIRGLSYGRKRGEQNRMCRQEAEAEKRRYCQRFGSTESDEKESDKNENEDYT